jgi:hypothetical protein
MTSAVLTDIGLGKCESDIDREQVLTKVVFESLQR